MRTGIAVVGSLTGTFAGPVAGALTPCPITPRTPDPVSARYQLALAPRCQGLDAEAWVAIERALAGAPAMVEARLRAVEIQTSTGSRPPR